MKMNRREALSAFSLGSVAMVRVEFPRQAQEGKSGTHPIAPLPFDPTKLRNLSEKLIVSHHANNYAGAVKNLNKVEAELANLTKDTPPFVVAGLKERELTFRNSATLHELYFGNLGGDGKLQGSIAEAIGATYGSTARFEELLRLCAMSLAGGSGWVVLGFDLLRNGLATYWSAGHPQNLAATIPLLVLDMYEHAFHIDYGAAASRYLDAFLANVHWQEVARRFDGARKASVALRG